MSHTGFVGGLLPKNRTAPDGEMPYSRPAAPVAIAPGGPPALYEKYREAVRLYEGTDLSAKAIEQHNALTP